MFIADGGGGSANPLPSYSGSTQTLRVEPEAIPEVRRVFVEARDKLKDKLDEANQALRARNWAADPVSRDTAEKFNQDTFEAGEQAAVAALTGYLEELDKVISQLDVIDAGYRGLDTGGASLVKRA
ncbi:hypothetical protein [Umezawaea beigongshangensis]|uniref:hypothetical protein n=1 Tax=Umezawaea beigongshangensis TaxID=2780383 RepID=UPI0018F1BB39|nr:hypothetical protein [Umezawaea beigongshangensis]